MGYHKATIEFPNSYKDDAVKKFLADYCEASNNTETHEHALNAFTENGVYVLGLHRAEGRKQIEEMRKKLWEAVPNRDHRAHRVFPYQTTGESKEQEFMVYGTVTYNHHDKRTQDLEWAGRGVVVKKNDDSVQLSLLHIFVDTER